MESTAAVFFFTFWIILYSFGTGGFLGLIGGSGELFGLDLLGGRGFNWILVSLTWFLVRGSLEGAGS